MNPALPYPLLADLVLGLHVLTVAFVVGGLVAIVVGNLLGWGWVNSLAFRLLHALAVAVVVLQAWLGAACPLTTLEMWLRAQAGLRTYSESFIGHWLQRLLYYDAPAWAFTVAYTLFALLAAAIWVLFPTRKRPR